MRIGFAVAVTLIAIGCKTTNGGQSTLNQTDVRTFEGELGMKSGAGFNTIADEVRSDCVDFDGLETGGGSQEATYQIKLVENHSDLLGQLGISASSQVKSAVPDGDIQASQKTKFAMGTTFAVNKYSVYMLVSGRVMNETTNLANARMKDSAIQKVTAGTDAGLEDFRQTCGNSYLKGFTTGGEFQALIEIQTDSDEMTASLKAGYSQRFGAANATAVAKGELETGLTNVASNKNLRIWTYQRGGQGEDEVGLVTTVPEVMARLKRLADSVKQGQNPRPITATFTDYLTLSVPLPSPFIEKLQNAQDFIDDLAKTQRKALDLGANLDYILQKPEGFVGVDGAKLRQMRDTKTQIDELLKKIATKGRACSTNLANCTMSTDVVTPSFELPKRKPTMASLGQEKLKIKTTKHYVNLSALSDGWFNPPECYLQVNVGGNGDKNFIPVRRTATSYAEPRCNNLTDEITVPMAIIKDTLKNLSVPLDRGWIQIVAYEDDPSYDDFIGEAWVYLRDLQAGAQLKGINNSNVNMDVGFEIEY